MSNVDGVATAPRRLGADEFLPTVDITRLSVDELEQLPQEDRNELIAGKLADVSHFYVGLSRVHEHVRLAADLLPEVRALPAEVRGLVRQPDRSPAGRLGVQPAVPGGAVVGRGVVTDELGVFTMPLGRIGPEGARLITTAGRLGLVVRGDHGGVVTTDVALPDPGGAAIGEVLLSMELEPLPRSIVAALIDLVDDLSVKPEEATLPDGTTVAVSLGEEACTFTFREDRQRPPLPLQGADSAGGAAYHDCEPGLHPAPPAHPTHPRSGAHDDRTTVERRFPLGLRRPEPLRSTGCRSSGRSAWTASGTR